MTPPLVLTLVRHGESVDNLTALWAGHRDSPLSNHGFNQSLRLADSFRDVPVDAIYTSDLQRARTTAENVMNANESLPKPAFTVSPLLREQNFGDAEGQPWDVGAYSSAHLPWDEHRTFTLAPQAESLNDVAWRADQALRLFIMPHLLAACQPGARPQHVMLFAHGIFLAEMLFSLKRAGDPHARFFKSGSYANTAWSRIEVRLDERSQVSHGQHALPSYRSSLESTLASLSHETLRGHELLPLPLPSGTVMPRITSDVVAVNQTEHLAGLKRQRGGIGSSAHDDKQAKLQAFFGGGDGGTS